MTISFDPEALLIVLGVLPIILLVWLLVEAFKTYGLINEESWLTAPKAGLSFGVLLGLIALSTELFPAAAVYIILATRYVFGGIFAGLFYELIGESVMDFVKATVARLFNRETEL